MRVYLDLPDGTKVLGLFITTTTKTGPDEATQWLTKPQEGMTIKFDEERKKIIVRKG